MTVQRKSSGSVAGSPLKEALWRQSGLYAQAARLSFVVGLLALVPSWYMFQVYGRVLDSRNMHTLAWLLLAAVGSFMVMELLEIARHRVMHQATDAVNTELNERVFNAAFQSNLRKQSGGTLQAFNDLRTVSDFLQAPVLGALMDLPASAVSLVLLYILSPWLCAVALGSVLLQAVLAGINGRRTSSLLAQANQAAIEAQMNAGGSLRNPQVIEAMGMEVPMYKRWMQRQRRHMTRLAEASDQGGTVAAASKLITGIQSSLLLGAGCWLALHNGLLGGAGMVIVASIFGGRVLAPLGQLVSQWRVIINAREAYRRLDLLLSGNPPVQPGMTLPAPKGALSVEAVMAAAPGSPIPILRGVTMSAAPGEAVMVIGPSGAGKTTLARVLIGVWPTTNGKVRLDGADVFTWHKSQLGPHLGYLPQGVELFDGTVAENIARFGKVDMAKVREAAAQVGITAMIEQLAQGFDTRIGNEGAVLSGGQRQRVGLARAIYGDPSFLVLDEPNASLDEQGEADLVALLKRLKARGVTIVAITHRSSLLVAADKLLLLYDGASAKFGPRDEVLAALQAATARVAPQPAPQPAQQPAPGLAPTLKGAAA